MVQSGLFILFYCNSTILFKNYSSSNTVSLLALSVCSFYFLNNVIRHFHENIAYVSHSDGKDSATMRVTDNSTSNGTSQPCYPRHSILS